MAGQIALPAQALLKVILSLGNLVLGNWKPCIYAGQVVLTQLLGAEDFHSQFYHWEDGCRVWATFQMESVQLVWRQKVGRSAFRHSRQVWASPCMLLGFQDDCLRTQVRSHALCC